MDEPTATQLAGAMIEDTPPDGFVPTNHLRWYVYKNRNYRLQQLWRLRTCAAFVWVRLPVTHENDAMEV
jgi:hypothetical protein